jgi:hypothetical protein
MTTIDENNFAQPLDEFRLMKHECVAEFDASLSGIGVIWYRVYEDGTEVPVGGCAVDLRVLGFGDDSSYQNTAEFIGATVATNGLEAMGLGGLPIRLRGDSVTALTWANENKFRSALVTPAAIVYTLQNWTRRIHIVDVEPISHDDIGGRMGSPGEKEWTGWLRRTGGSEE